MFICEFYWVLNDIITIIIIIKLPTFNEEFYKQALSYFSFHTIHIQAFRFISTIFYFSIKIKFNTVKDLTLLDISLS